MGNNSENNRTKESWYSRATPGQKFVYWILVTPFMGLGLAVWVGQLLGISHTDIFPQSSVQTAAPIATPLPEDPSLHPDSPGMDAQRERVSEMATSIFENYHRSLQSNPEDTARLLGGTISGPTPVAQSKLVDLKTAAHTPQLAAIGSSSLPTAKSAI